MGRKVTQDEVKKWLALKERDYTDRAIGKKFNRDEKTIAKYLRPYLEEKGEGSPPDSELEALKRLKEKYKVLLELEKLKEEYQGLPKRFDQFEVKFGNLTMRVNAYGEDLDRVRLQLKSIPIVDWKCSVCGSSYTTIYVGCSRCGDKRWWGFVCPPDKKIKMG